MTPSFLAKCSSQNSTFWLCLLHILYIHLRLLCVRLDSKRGHSPDCLLFLTALSHYCSAFLNLPLATASASWTIPHPPHITVSSLQCFPPSSLGSRPAASWTIPHPPHSTVSSLQCFPPSSPGSRPLAS